jgi:hypothetical protein
VGVGKGGIMYNGGNGEEKKTQSEEKRKVGVISRY